MVNPREIQVVPSPHNKALRKIRFIDRENLTEVSINGYQADLLCMLLSEFRNKGEENEG